MTLLGWEYLDPCYVDSVCCVTETTFPPSLRYPQGYFLLRCNLDFLLAGLHGLYAMNITEDEMALQSIMAWRLCGVSLVDRERYVNECNI